MDEGQRVQRLVAGRDSHDHLIDWKHKVRIAMTRQ
jgi:hypothetical protein